MDRRTHTNEITPRRGFFTRIAASAMVIGLTGLGSAPARAAAGAEDGPGGPDDWIKNVKGTHRCLFDFPQHKNGLPLLHILNYLNTYSEAYKTTPGQVGAVGTFYGIGGQSSIPLAFNDAMWAKYDLGAYTGLKDGSGKPHTRNVLNKPTSADLNLVMEAYQSPPIPMLAGVLPALGIESLQKMGTTFLLCANAFGGWCAELEARGNGKMADIQAELKANMLPGVTIVPAMVIAIEAAQGAGIAYNRQ
jgi:intracellular sulfur oxidation DsrE/DsrF family protein